jgi:hypothetical protein
MTSRSKKLFWVFLKCFWVVGSLRLLAIFFPFLTCLFVMSAHQFISRLTHLKCFLLLLLMFHYPFEFIPTNISDISQADLLLIRWKLFWLQILFQKSNKNERNILNFKQQSLINLNFKANFYNCLFYSFLMNE